MKIVLSNDQMRAMDQTATTQYAVPSIVLMENAGRNSAEIIHQYCQSKNIRNAEIICGKGNNGGDGFVIARYLQKYGMDVCLYLLAEPAQIKGDARINLDICQKSGLSVIPVNKAGDIRHTPGAILVDAILGTGIRGEVSGLYAAVIKRVMAFKNKTIFSVDIPSGINGDNAIYGPVHIQADYTLTMAAAKRAQLFYPAKEHVGTLHIVDIGFPSVLYNEAQHRLFYPEKKDIILPERNKRVHKHSAGKVLIVGASSGFTGAVCLAAKGASLAGAGLVTVAVPQSLNTIIEIKLTEQMSLPLPDAGTGILKSEALDILSDKLQWADVLLVGPGLGRDSESLAVCKALVERAVSLDKKMVLDADTLFWLSQEKDYLNALNHKTVLTPHQGEFARLFPAEKENLLPMPWLALQNALKQTDATINLKGPVSIAGSRAEGSYINTTGNPGLAKGGSGDMLGGMIAGFMAAGLPGLRAAFTANYIHGNGADRAAKKFGPQSFSLEDLITGIKESMAEE